MATLRPPSASFPAQCPPAGPSPMMMTSYSVLMRPPACRGPGEAFPFSPFGALSLRAVRVLFCIDSLAGGGTERSLAELLPPLRARGVAPAVVCLKRAGGEIEDAVSAAFEVRFLRARGRARTALELRRVLSGERPDVLHTHLFEADVLGRLAAARGSASVLTSLVNATYDPARLADPRVPRAKLAAARRIDGWTARHLTDGFHAVSDEVARAAVAALGIPAEKITVIERGRDA